MILTLEAIQLLVARMVVRVHFIPQAADAIAELGSQGIDDRRDRDLVVKAHQRIPELLRHDEIHPTSGYNSWMSFGPGAALPSSRICVNVRSVWRIVSSVPETRARWGA